MASQGASPTSPVDGLTPADLRAAVDAPVPAERARLAGPVAESVRLPSGGSVWRLRIPGPVAVRSARATVAVGGHRFGLAVEGPHLQSLVAVSRRPAGLVDGAEVTVTWEGSAPRRAGRLRVIR